MSFHEILIAVMAAFAVAGAIDRIFGNRWGLGKEFEEGILAMGSLALAMVGIVCLAPVLAGLLKPVIVPVFAFLGADPAMFAGTILACDMGGGALAVELAASHQAAMLGGVLTGSMLGATVVFTIPVAMGILEEKDRPVMAKGILCGIVTIPLGVLAGGLTAGFPIGMVLRNLIPIVIIGALIALGLWRAENAMVRGFEVFGRLVVAVVTVGLAAAVVEALTGFVIIPGMAPISEGFETVGTIAIVLAGAFPLMKWITSTFGKALGGIGSRFGLKKDDCAGMIGGLANLIPLVTSLEKMGSKGKIVSLAFGTGSFAVFGDFLGFTAGVDQEMLVPMILGKVTAGIAALIIANFMTPKLLEKIDGTSEEPLISRLTLRSMKQARYTVENTGHFGLAADCYCHFTSPIRRYPDLQIHRIIKDSLRGRLGEKRIGHYTQILPEVAKHASEMERRADEAERETIKLKKVQYMENHIGETFAGVISGVAEYGFFVELENTVEGLVRVTSLTDDFYQYYEETYELVGEATNRRFKLGQQVRVTVDNCDRIMRTIDFTLADSDEN